MMKMGLHILKFLGIQVRFLPQSWDITTATIVGVPCKCAGQVSMGNVARPHQQLSRWNEPEAKSQTDVGEAAAQ